MAGSATDGGSTKSKDKDKGPESTPGSLDLANATQANPSAEQVTQQGGEAVPAEGERIREQARKDAEEREGYISLDQALHETDPGLAYDERGALVNADGKRIALSADATDPDVGWTVQQAGAHVKEKDRVAYPGGPATVPDQTFHPDELPDPLAAVRAGLLPQNVEVLNIDPEKFAGKKSLEP